jgi:maltooligosyltrehalose trehalohydrolase
MLLSPYLPLLFMGEEYGDRRPFPFFCSFCGAELIEAVRQGRKREFADFVTSADEVPDPHACATFEAARLTWAWPAGTEAGHTRALYRDLLAMRRAWAGLREAGGVRLTPDATDGPVLDVWRGAVRVTFNLSDREMAMPDGWGRAVAFTSEAARYGGRRGAATERVRVLLPWECVVSRE